MLRRNICSSHSTTFAAGFYMDFYCRRSLITYPWFRLLRHFNLMIDCGRNLIRDTITNLQGPLKISQSSDPVLQFNVCSSESATVRELLQEFSSLTSPVYLPKGASKTKVFHRIETSDAPPVYAKFRRLTEDKLRISKIEFG